ncbi:MULTISPECIES: hypothetical protein [Gordonia]|jgi:hypothetical protein|nr:hypothetical protein [Gordonia malaquae]SED34778.1 hypothetical protein SAMN04488550_2366 [Gordonia malaquae]
MLAAFESDLIDWSDQQIEVDRDDGLDEFPVTWRQVERRGIGIELHS